MKTLMLILVFILVLRNENFSETIPRNQTIEDGEYFIGVDPGEGNGIPIMDTYSSVNINTSFDAQLTPGDVIYVRFKSSNRKWSASRGFKYKYKDLVTAEYYIKHSSGVQTQWTAMSTPINEPLNSPFFFAVSPTMIYTENDSVFVRFKSNDHVVSQVSKDIITGVEDCEGHPEKFLLLLNYPNPFNPSTTISFSLPETEFVTLKIYDMLGREITTLVNEEKSPGYYSLEFDGRELASGTYIYRIQTSKFIEAKKLILMR